MVDTIHQREYPTSMEEYAPHVPHIPLEMDWENHLFTAARSVHFVDSDEAYTQLQVLFLVSAKSNGLKTSWDFTKVYA